jgi:aspartate kinase
MAGTTNGLVEALGDAGRGDESAALATLEAIASRTQACVRQFFGAAAEPVWRGLQPLWEELTGMARAVAVLRSAPADTRDSFLACGERISVAVVAAALSARGLPTLACDARAVLRTDDRFGRAQPDLPETRRLATLTLAPLLEAGTIPVLGGFIGSAPDGRTTTLGRGGSDYSAAILGAALDAASVEIWTDVDGMMTTDPRIVADARRIETLSFDEA